jgi:hypothetical protein
VLIPAQIATNFELSRKPELPGQRDPDLTRMIPKTLGFQKHATSYGPLGGDYAGQRYGSVPASW